MSVVVRYTEHASNDLRALDILQARLVVKKIRAYCETPHPMRFAKSLSGPFTGLFRFRVGDYRVIFERTRNGSFIIFVILRIKHRKEVYE